MKRGAFLLLFFGLSLQVLGEREKWLSPDFFVLSAPSTGAWDRSDDCRGRIAKVICVVDPVEEPGGLNRPCDAGSTQYAKYFEALYDAYPPVLQKMFCSLRVIYVEKKFFGSAYAGQLTDGQGKPDGALIGIRKSVLDEALSLKTWASWKEQLSFGGVADSYTVTADLPQIRTRTPEAINDFLYFVIAHEFGHLFDFANNLNRWLKAKDGEEHAVPGSWSALSWDTSEKPLADQDFPGRSGLCFYTCTKDKPLSKLAVKGLYEALFYHSNFISTYGSTNPYDDFADSSAYYMMARYLHTRYVIDTRQGERYPILRKLGSFLFFEKYHYLSKFYETAKIVYP